LLRLVVSQAVVATAEELERERKKERQDNTGAVVL
jgi:hypothetical protein